MIAVNNCPVALVPETGNSILQPASAQASIVTKYRQWAAALLCAVLPNFCPSLFAQTVDQAKAGKESGEESEAPNADPLAKMLGGQIFFDAERTSFNKDLTRQIYEGNVVAIAAGTMISADNLSLDKNTNIVTANGHIVVINRNVIFLGDDLTYHILSGDMKLGQASMYSNNPDVVADATTKILGFTSREIAFEAERQKRLKELRELKDRLRAEARRQAILKGSVPDDLIEKYAVYLEQEELISLQENQSLARLPQEKREAFKRRRVFWEASKKSGLSIPVTAATTAYFHIQGETLIKVDGNDYYARNSLFTPCYCKPGESPAWAFNAREIEAQVGGYADLYHPVLEIKGIPILYLPWLKFPLKDRRQSGFLMPTFGYSPRSGNIYSQPVFLDLGQSADATLKTDIYEKRGTRIGAEYRVQQREFSGWEIQAELIRDRLWLDDREIRRDLRTLYNSGLDDVIAGKTVSRTPDPNFDARDYLEWSLQQRQYWDDLAKGSPYKRSNIEQAEGGVRNDINTYLNVPENTWRGSYGWRGVTYLAPRLSFVSAGVINSDHRYAEELYVPEEFEDVIFGGRSEPAFATTKGQFHLDSRDFYLGLGTRFGDNYLTDERFEGQQLPLRLKIQSRFFSVLPDSSIVPLYGQVSAEHYRISEYKSAAEERNSSPTLGGGNWRRLKADFVSPWMTESIIQVSQFADFEARYIEHGGLSSKSSEIKSWRTGLEFRLPIDGKGQLPEYFQVEPCSDEQAESGECVQDEVPGAKKHIHHIMDWRLRFSVRPSVVKIGPYTEGQEIAGDFAYFAGDKAYTNSDIDREVLEEDRMREHRRLSLGTDHVWKLFNKDWRRIAAGSIAEAPTEKNAQETSNERARRELLYNLERPVTSDVEIYDENSQQFLVDRYQLYEQYYLAPMTFHGDVAYDFLDAEIREDQKKSNRVIDEDINAEVAARSGLEAQLQAENEKPVPDANVVSALAGQIAGRTGRITALQKTRTVLVEPWKEANFRLGFNYAGYSLGTNATYNIYAKTAKSIGANLALPTMLKSNLSFGYSLTKDFVSDNVTTARVTRTRVRSYRLATSLIPLVSTYAAISHRLIDGAVRSYSVDFKTAYGVRYDSDSRCWGLQFAREKDYGDEEREATYLLRLSVIFTGQQRYFPNMSPGLEREVKDDNES